MSIKKVAAFMSALLLHAGMTQAQTTGEIYGKATDKSGAVVPGVTVTLASPALLQPQAAVTSGTGVYRFPGVPIGVYSVKFVLQGFTTVVRDGIRIEIGQNAQINGSLDVSAMQEVVTITGEAPLIDMHSNTRINHFNQEALQNIPSARDPWVIIQQSAGIVMDRENIGGNMSGQQSNFVARGATMSQQKFNLDGIDITDMSATGASPTYYDFDAFEEMQISTGGADVTMQTSGVGINLVTKSGSDKFKGSGRYYITDQKFQSVNVSDSLRRDGATSGNPIQNIKDYGFEMGGPIVKGKAWIWGSYGTQDVKVGVNGFFLKDSEQAGCGKFKGLSAAQLSTFPFADVKACLNTDLTTLNTYNLKFNYQVSRKDTFSLFANLAEKIRNARGASDLVPIDSTNRQKGVDDPTLGSKWWKTGTPKTYKASLRHIFSDRFLMEFQYAHIGNNFVLDHHDDALATVQPSVNIQTTAIDRSSTAQKFVRPTNSFDITGTHSSSGFLGGDHALKFGIRYRQDRAISTSHRGGNVDARFNEVAGVLIPAQAQIYRDSYTDYNLFDQSAYFQDTFTRNRFTLMAGVRFDRQWDRANQSVVSATPFYGQATQTGLVFNQLPAVNFGGADTGVRFNNLAPRVGFTWDVKGDAHSVIKANYARYAAQLGDGETSSVLNPVVQTTVRYPWSDLNGDRFVQPGEINISGQPLAFTAGYDPANPGRLATSGTVDPNIKLDYTNEFILGFDKQFSNSFALGIAGIYRRYGDFRFNDTIGLTEANYAPVSYNADCAAVPAAQHAQCPTVTYYQPTSNLANFPNYVFTNQPGQTRTYKGIEVTGRKRVKSFNMNGSFTWSDTKEYFPLGSYEDPTNVVNRDGAQYAPQTAGSGITNVFLNAKWLLRATASYTIPWQHIGIAANYNGRSGYPAPTSILTPTRINGAGTATVYLAPQGDNRLAAFHDVDFRLDKTVAIKAAKITFSADVFNVLNANTVQGIRLTQNASNANLISSLVAPRVIRFGARVNW